MILITGAIIGLLLVLFKTPFDSLIASVFFITLSCLYYILGFALFNNIPLRKIFKAEFLQRYWNMENSDCHRNRYSPFNHHNWYYVFCTQLSDGWNYSCCWNSSHGNNNYPGIDEKCAAKESVLQKHHLKEFCLCDHRSNISPVTRTFIRDTLSVMLSKV